MLKWAQSKQGYFGLNGEQVWLSEPSTSVWVHKLRHEADAILVGARTIETDNPSLTTRHYPGKSPHRVVYDPSGRLHQLYNVFDADECKVFYFSSEENPVIEGPQIQKFIFQRADDHIDEMLDILFAHQIGVLVVEGGMYLHNLFIKQNKWDEAWVIKTQHPLEEGIIAPNVWGRLIDEMKIGNDTVLGIFRDSIK